MVKGCIFEIIRGSCVDGPGLRTTVFFKGCNMRCKWCHNPESWSSKPCEIKKNDKMVQCGVEYTVEELFDKIIRDKDYFGDLGGVTFSGGECLLQSDFLYEVLKKCKENGIHTAVDTAGNVDWKILEKVLPFVDLFLYDLKCFSNIIHIQNTRVSNDLIKENLKRIVGIVDVLVRIPIIPNINTSENELFSMSKFLSDIGVQKVELLPYHSLGEVKYKQLGLSFNKFDIPTEEEMKRYKDFFKGVIV